MANLPLQVFKLQPFSELRFEVESLVQKVSLKVKCGFAELFGSELVKNKIYEFKMGAKVAVFTWQGCKLELRGRPEISYIAKRTPMVNYLNIHEALEQQRTLSETGHDNAPVTMIVGAADVGKSTLTKILLNYAVRIGRRPIYVDLDVAQGDISMPGTIGSMLIERQASIEEGFTQDVPLVYHFGHMSLCDNLELYKLIVATMAKVVHERSKRNKKNLSSGIIINTCGLITGDGYKMLTYIAQTFKVNVILVLDNERLQNVLIRDIPESVKVVSVPKSAGVIQRTSSQLAAARGDRIKAYFYGKRIAYFPHLHYVEFSDLKIFKVETPLPASFMPVGMPASLLVRVVVVSPSPALQNRMLSVSFTPFATEGALNFKIVGFLCVTAVDMERKMVTILSPQPQLFPNQVLLLSDIHYNMDSH